MRVAVVSDIHGNRTALEAVLEDLRETSPDAIFHGGDLAHGGSSPVEIVDRIRDLGWPGVLGNTDEVLFRPASLTEFMGQSPFAAVIEEMAQATRAALGPQRIAWLSELPFRQNHGSLALIHASPTSCWRSPMPEAADEELENVYAPLGKPVVVYCHIHKPFVRSAGGMTIANSGSVSLAHDGDPRAKYLLLDDDVPQIRRVEYDMDRELEALRSYAPPHCEWLARMLQNARPEMP